MAAVEAASGESTLPAHTRYVGLAAGESDRPDLQSAKRVVSGGRGVGSEENFKIIFDFADKLGFAVVASRAAVNVGYVPNELHVGETNTLNSPALQSTIRTLRPIQPLYGIQDVSMTVVTHMD